MHQAAHQWVAAHASGEVIVDVGGRNINGTVRDLFPGADYTPVDIYEGPGVDVVGDFLDYKPKRKADTVVCCEVAEHTAEWPALIAHAAEILKVGGRIIFTAAGPGRAPHSAMDGAEPREDEHYENIDPEKLRNVLRRHFADVQVDVFGDDVRAVAVKRGKR
jgi:SAM-dependent methyltransferase